MKIIGILGLIGSGKDTIGEYLVKEYKFIHDSLATPLKDAVSAIFCWDRVLLEGKTVESRIWRDEPDLWWEKELNWTGSPFARVYPRFTPRVALQLFATEMARDTLHNDIWILSLKNRLLKAQNDTVITDCRFPNECNVISALGGTIIRVQRGLNPSWVNHIQSQIACNPNWLNDCRDYGEEHGIHASEWMSFTYKEDFLLRNDGTIAELHKEIDDVLNLVYVF